MNVNIELTDTFGGEANYSWVRRGIASCHKPTIRARVRAAKAWAGWQGIKCFIERMPDECETLIVRPRSGLCQVMFVSIKEEDSDA